MTAPAAAASQSSARSGRNDRVGRRQLRRAGLLAAQHLPDVAGQDHGLRVDPSQQPDRQQVRHRPIRGRAGRGVAGPPHRGPFEQLLQHVALAWVEPVDQIGDLFAAARGVLERDLPRVPRQRRAGIGGHPHRGLAPGQGALLEVIQRADHVGFGGAVADQRQQLGRRHRCRIGLQHQQRVEHGQPQEVEVVGGGFDRLPGLSARGERGDAARWRLGEVRPQLEQPDQPLVRQVGKPGPQRDVWGGVVGHR